jgi:predicted  nucleic acid-binding Zn-ribbon protein
MAIEQITVWKCVCDKCGHIWVSKNQIIPAMCAKCRTVTWNRGKDEQDIIPVLLDSETVSKKRSELDERFKQNEKDLLDDLKSDRVPLSEQFQADEDFDDLINVEDSGVEELVVDENVDFGS